MYVFQKEDAIAEQETIPQEEIGTAFSDRAIDRGLRAYAYQDYATALELLLPIAYQGDAHCQYLCGRMYALGLGTKVNENEASCLLSMAAFQDDLDAMEFMDRMDEDPDSFDLDQQEEPYSRI